ncbi:kinase [Carnobacterium gallinarum]|uniref:kinase n=1 Tax=Carnobacterium gallinarum TaxID=2749 RepID=UPI000551ADEE|nr:kinase [Carnobacterium gallinarum]
MKTQLILIRGNSGSGKTTIAKELQRRLGRGTLLVSQDVVRREMLRVHDQAGNLSIELIQQIAAYGKGKVEFVIVEGILRTETYREMLDQLMSYFDNEVLVYYFDLPFEETVKRHQMREISGDFSAERMKKWWREKDYLHISNETLFTLDMSQEELVEKIVVDIDKSRKNNKGG